MVDLGPLHSDDPRLRLLHQQPPPPRWYELRGLLHRIARRCPTHDRSSHVVTSRLERQLGMKPSEPPASFTDQFADPTLIDCGHAWCRTRRR